MLIKAAMLQEKGIRIRASGFRVEGPVAVGTGGSNLVRVGRCCDYHDFSISSFGHSSHLLQE